MTLIRNKCTKVYLRGTKMLLKIGIILCGASDDLHYLFCVWICLQGRTRGRQRDTISGRRTTAVAPKKINNVTRSFFSTVHLLPKDLRFEHGGAEFASCPGSHLTSLRFCMHGFCVYALRLLAGFFGRRSGFFWERQVGNPAKQQTQQD